MSAARKINPGELRPRVTTIKNVVVDHLEWMRTNGYSETTIKGRGTHLKNFREWCRARGLRRIAEADRDVLERYSRWLFEGARDRSGRPLSVPSRRERLVSVRSLFRSLLKRGMIAFDPASELELPREEKRLPRVVLAAREAEAVLAVPDVDSPGGLRDRALLEILYSTGLRRAEIIALLIEDVDFERGTVFVRAGKGRKDRVVPAGERSLLWLGRYLREVRPSLAKTPDPGTLFLNDRGIPFARSALSVRVSDYVERSGIGKRGSCHVFRHSAATLMMENGADLRYVQEFLGHEHIDTTRIYLAVSAKRLRAAHALFHPAEREDVGGEGEDDAPAAMSRVRDSRPPLPRGPRGQRSAGVFAAGEDLRGRIADHLSSLARRNYSPKTITGRGRYLGNFAEWCGDRGVGRAEEVDSRILEAWTGFLSRGRRRDGAEWSRAHRREAITAVRVLFADLAKRGVMLFNPAAGLSVPRREKRLPGEVLSHEEVLLMLAVPDVRDVMGLRDRALLELLYATGLRGSELIALAVSGVDFERGTVFVRNGKGKKDRVVPGGERALMWVRRYLERSRPELSGEDDPGNLFLTYHGRPLSGNLPSLIAKRCARAAGIGKSAGCLVLRRTMATLLLENGADVRVVQEMLGHEKLTTTQIYANVSVRKLREVHARTHPARMRPPDITDA